MKKGKATKGAKKTVKKALPSASKKTSAPKKKGIEPLGDRVLLKPLTPEEAGRKLASGIIIPETVDKEKPETGRVVAVGPGKRGDDNELIPVGVSVGDRVVFSKYGYDEIKVDGVEYYLVAESNILAILN
jgi:chaperonin GroES